MEDKPDMFQDLSTQLLQSGYTLRFRPTGHSMHPTIQDGEAVIVEPIKASSIKKGDIILHHTQRGLIAHRIISIENTEGRRLFHLRGDACSTNDEPVTEQQILGKITSVERNGRQHNLNSLRSKLMHTARVYTSQLKTRVCGAHNPQFN